MLMCVHPDASCRDCGEDVLYGTKREGTRSKLYVECSGCQWEAMAGWVDQDAPREDILETARSAPRVSAR